VVDRWLTGAAESLRVAVANIENLVDPEAVVMGGQVPDRYLAEILARMEPLLPSVSQRSDRPSRRIVIGTAGGISAALGGATLPLFSRLTTQPRATKAPPRARVLTARQSGSRQAAIAAREHSHE
jgi:predicted NBD/HSP70 family sugar kinase